MHNSKKIRVSVKWNNIRQPPYIETEFEVLMKQNNIWKLSKNRIHIEVSMKWYHICQTLATKNENNRVWLQAIATTRNKDTSKSQQNRKNTCAIKHLLQGHPSNFPPIQRELWQPLPKSPQSFVSLPEWCQYHHEQPSNE